ncbi:MAG: TonB-dependent receptor, partial [Proteobacteria bacterium]|nr:TonB-dependent receptor [Pseudomonadota bacterium]
ALFGQLTIAVAENWDVTVGARSTEEDKAGFKEYVGIISASGKGSFDDTTGTFIISHDYSENTNLYFKVADGFKAGGFNGESSNPYEAATPYAPETISSTEFGLKGKYFNNRMMFNVAYFDNEHKDMQISYFTANAAAASEVINNSADISGLEIETTTLINDTTKLMVNLGTLDSEFTGNKVASDGYKLEQVPYSPETTLYVSLEKDYGAYRMRLDHSRIGEHPTFPYSSQDPRAALTTLASRATTDFRLLTEPMENLQLNFWIKNLGDKGHRMSSIPFGPAFGQLTLSYFSAPRTIGMDLHYKF